MTIPVCPVHGTAMRPSAKGGGFFCSKKNADGNYCTQKAAGAPQSPAQPVPAPPPHSTSPQPANPLDGRYHLAAAALTSASWIWGQLDPTMHDEVAACAERMFQRMERLVKS